MRGRSSGGQKVRLRLPRLQCAPSVVCHLAIRTLLALLLWALPLTIHAKDYAGKIAPLIDPAKLATLGQRGANPRMQKCMYWLGQARNNKESPAKILDSAIASAGYRPAATELTKAQLLRSLDIATKLGCFDADGLAEMKRGRAPTIRRGPYAGQELTVDHIVPRGVAPELDNVIANLELLPSKLNSAKWDKLGPRQLAHAAALNRAGLLSDTGLAKVRQVAQDQR